MASMAPDERVIHSDPEILGGTPVFVGTRVWNRRRTCWLRILLDECVPRRLKRSLRGHQLVLTVPEAGFAGLKKVSFSGRSTGSSTSS
jgi:hypothetical protein